MNKKQRTAVEMGPSTPQYMEGCPEAFVRQADVRFVVEGVELPVHSQFLSRHCAFFANMFEDLEFGESSRGSNPLRLEDPFKGMKLRHICLFLSSLYNPGEVHSSVNSAELADLDSFAGVYEMADKFGAQLLKRALDERLADPSADGMFKKDLFGWVQLAERFQLSQLRGHCVDLLLCLLADPGQKAQQQVLDWQRADKKLVLQLLDGALQSLHKLQRTSTARTPGRHVVNIRSPRITVTDVVDLLPDESTWTSWQNMFDAYAA